MTIAWTKTAGELSAMSAQRVQMLGDAQSLSGHRWNLWKDHANDFLKVAQTKGPNEWRRASQTVVLVAATATYTLSPRPYKVASTIFYRDAAGRDMPITRWNQDQYDAIPYKTTQGYPACFIVNRQRTATTLTLWNVPSTAIALGTLIVPYDRVIEDVASPSDIVDVPQEWLGPVADVLGVRLADSFNLSTPAIEKVRERADLWLNELLGDDHDESVIFTFETE